MLSGGVNLMQCHCSCMRAKSTLTVYMKKKKKKISSTLMGQESSENFIYTFTKKMQICNVRLRHRLSSLFIQEGGPDKT